MDPHVRWLRRRVWRRAVIGLAITFVTAGSACGTGAAIAAAEPWVAVAVAVAGGQVAVLARLAHAFARGPLGPRFLRRYAEVDLAWTPVPGGADLHPDGRVLSAWGLSPVAVLGAVCPANEPRERVDFHVDRSHLVLAGIDHDTGAVTLLTRTSAGRIVTTSRLAVPPSTCIVANQVVRGRTEDLVRAHHWMLGQLGERGERPIATDAGIWTDAQRLEQEAHRDLGPWLGSLFDTIGAGGFGRLKVRVPPDRIRSLAVAGIGPAPTRARLRPALVRRPSPVIPVAC